MSSKSYLVSAVSADGSSKPLAVCPSLAEADAMVDKLNAALPKGVLEFYSRVPVEAAVKPGFRVAKLASALASFAESF